MDSIVEHKDLEEHFKEKYGLPPENCQLLAKQFCATFKESLAEISSACENQDGNAVKMSAHKLKGALLNSGLEELAEIARKIENNAFEIDSDLMSENCRLIKDSLKNVL